MRLYSMSVQEPTIISTHFSSCQFHLVMLLL